MRKEYVAPVSTLCTIQVEGMIATSLQIGNKPGPEMLSIDDQNDSWGSSIWSDKSVNK